MIDFELEMKNIQPINIKNIEFSHYSFNDDIKKSFVLYNTAVSEIRTMELDLAIEDLKKVLSYNPGFSEAIKVLGLCYINNKEYRKAEKTFKKLAKCEMYSEIANEYIENLLVEKNMKKTLEVIKKVKDNCDNGVNQHNLSKHLRKRIIVGGVTLSVLIAGFIIGYRYSSIMQVYANSKTVNSDKEKKAGLNMVSSAAQQENKSVENKTNNKQADLESHKDKNEIEPMLTDAEKCYDAESYEKAADILLQIKDVKFDEKSKIRFDTLWSDIKTRNIWTIYNEGNKLYKEGKYKEALPKLKIVYEVNPDIDVMPWATYQVGVCYKEGNDNANALAFFKKVKEKYPKSEYVSYSDSMINEIGKK